MKIVTMLNKKGGVGKTSCTYHMAGAMAASGLKILAIDNDPQASLTQGFWGPAATEAISPSETIAAIYAGEEPYPEIAIKPTGIPGIDIVPGSEHAEQYNLPGIHAIDPEIQRCLAAFLDSISPGSYDVVLIDCPPNLLLCSWASLIASGYLITPLQPEEFGSQGLPKVQRFVAKVREFANPRLDLLGYLLTKVSKSSSTHKAVEETLREVYGDDVFAAKMPDSKDYYGSISERRPVAQYKPRSVAAKAMAEIAEEAIKRMATRERRQNPQPDAEVA